MSVKLKIAQSRLSFLVFVVAFPGNICALEASYLPARYKKLNFGVVVNNGNYTIYRSKKLGSKGLRRLKAYLKVKKLSFPKVIIYMNKNGYSFPFYFAIKEYKSRHKYNFKFLHSFGKDMRTYVDGHNPYSPSLDIDSRLYLGMIGRRYFSLQDDGIDGGIETFFAILEYMLQHQRTPLLFHCHGGMHRTGMMAMALRYIQGGFWVDGPKVYKKKMWLNPAQYEYYKFNKFMFRKDNIKFINQLSEDIRFLDIKYKYQELLRDGSEDQF